MAIPFLNNINLSDNELQNAKLHVTSTAPTAAAAQIYFDSTLSDLTAKYYSNSTDLWVSLKEYSFPAGTYVAPTVTGTTPKPIITFDLNAVDGTAAVGERYLTKSNTWAEVSGISGTTYDLEGVGSTNGTAGVRLSGSDATNDDVLIVGAGTTTVTRTGNTLTVTSNDQFTGTVTSITEGPGITVTPSATSPTVAVDYLGSDNYLLEAGAATVASSEDIINFSDDSDSNVKKTTLGTIPVDSLTLVKNYIDSSISGGVYYQGGYDPTIDSTSPGNYGLQVPPNPNIIEIGWMYTVTADGFFFSEQVRVGDVLIAEIDAPTSLSDWTTVQNNIDLASLTQVGIGNVNIEDAGDKDGLSLAYASGTATVGLDITGLPNLSVAITAADLDSLEIPLYNGDTSDANEKIEVSALLSAASSKISYATTIIDTTTISHGLASSDVMVQLYDITTGETVYADVDRISTTQVTITFASTPTNSVRVLVQKIG